MSSLDTSPESSFAALDVESADILLALTPRMPLIMTDDNVKDWLNQQHVRDILEIADSSGDHWFDYYEVDRNILSGSFNSSEPLRPISLSYRELEAKKELLDNLDFSDERFNRNNSKGR